MAVLEKPAHPLLASAGGDVGDALKGRRAAVHRESGGEQQWPVYDRELLRAGHELRGPSIVEEPSATTLILASYKALVDGAGNLLIRKETA
jgi:N-methylhydantoinase A